MTFQQLKYIIAIDTHRHFIDAAADCYVTQATLSMMVKKLEDELKVVLFDRSKQPVVPTQIGIKIIEQARIAVAEAEKLYDIIESSKGEIRGDLRLGIIPTVAPYILPLFLQQFLDKYPNVRLHISEITTSEIIQKLQRSEIDAGILATPLNETMLREQPLFYEEFLVYSSSNERLLKKKFILAEDIDINKLWLLEEGHCLRSQVMNLCALKKQEKEVHQLDFAAGSIETLMKIVEINQGMTIIPELALANMTAKQKKYVRYFKKPAPVREIGLVTYRHFIKDTLIQALVGTIQAAIPESMKIPKQKNIMPIHMDQKFE
jgi:LysR family hydrogen peroxide-inducible transcriptional activator